MTLKQGQGHQTWYELVDPKHSYNDAKFEKPHLHSVHEKTNSKVLVKSGNTSIISLECDSQKQGYTHELLDVLNNPR